MKKAKRRKPRDELRAEYDSKLFNSGIRGKYAANYRRAAAAKKSESARDK